MKELDCRGLPCPQPVINTKDALEELKPGEKLTVLVDNEAAVQNVSRFVEAQGHRFQVEKEDNFWRVFIIKGETVERGVPISCGEQAVYPVCVVLSAKGMGSGDPTLSTLLLKAFLKTLAEAQEKPKRLICYNEGVFLALEDSEVLEDLKKLEKLGVEILVCGTCLDYYQVKDKLAVGVVSNMYDILETLLSSRVLKP